MATWFFRRRQGKSSLIEMRLCKARSSPTPRRADPPLAVGRRRVLGKDWLWFTIVLGQIRRAAHANVSLMPVSPLIKSIVLDA